VKAGQHLAASYRRAADKMEPVLKQKDRLAAVSPKSDQVF
jgi:hypothetical protein